MNPIIAYIDAGSGSLVVQLLAGGLAGAAAFIRFRWSNIRGRVFVKGRDLPEAVNPEE